MPAGAERFLPLLGSALTDRWPSAPAPIPAVLAGQVEQESQWRSNARGRGSFGLAQPLGSTWRAWRAIDRDLLGWRWSDRFDPRRQLLLLVLIDRSNWGLFDQVDGEWLNRAAFMLAAYNVGLGGILGDIRRCRAAAECNPRRWFGHVAGVRSAGRGYVRIILLERADHYRDWRP